MRRLAVLGLAMFGLLAGGSGSALATGCITTDLFRDNHFLTALLVNPGAVTGPVDVGAIGCDIGVYVNAATTTVTGANVFGARYFGVAVNGAAAGADVVTSSVHDIGDVPLSGAQHGVAIAYIDGASGTVHGNTIWNYQKNGMLINGTGTHATVTDNTVTGDGPTDRIAQNGIQVSRGATVDAFSGNVVSDNIYTQAPPGACARPAGVGSCVGVIATGILFFQTGVDYKTGDIASQNHAFRNQCDNCIIK